MRRALILALVFVWGGLSLAQDPGIPDTVSFGPWEAIVPADSPWTGNIRVPVRIFNDESLSVTHLVFTWSGPWTPVGARFVGARGGFPQSKVLVVDSVNNVMVLYAEVVPGLGKPFMPPDTGVFAYLCFSTEDTGIVEVDTVSTSIPEEFTHFLTDERLWIRPKFEGLTASIGYTGFTPGDIEGNKAVTLSDIISLANFVFKGSFKPPVLNLCDVNADCRVDIVDIVYLINVVLRNRFSPMYGCSC